MGYEIRLVESKIFSVATDDDDDDACVFGSVLVDT